jgi:hypothetical protein
LSGKFTLFEKSTIALNIGIDLDFDEPPIVVTGSRGSTQITSDEYLQTFNFADSIGSGNTPELGSGSGILTGVAAWGTGDPDGNGNGIDDADEDNYEDIIVDAGLTPNQIAIAQAIAEQRAFEQVAVQSFLAGAASFELSSFLEWLGMSTRLANGTTAVASAVGVPDAGQAIGLTLERVEGVYFNIIAMEMRDNPDAYGEWIIDPFTGLPLDTSTLDYVDD